MMTEKGCPSDPEDIKNIICSQYGYIFYHFFPKCKASTPAPWAVIFTVYMCKNSSLSAPP